MRKAVLIAPANDFAGNLNVSRITALMAPPLGILAVGSFLAAHHVPVELIDVQMDFGFGLDRAAEGVVTQRVVEHLSRQRDEIAWIGISQLSNTSNGIELAQKIQAAIPEVPIILGGYFPSGAYQTLLKKYPFLTAIVRGDGEEAALKISQVVDQESSFQPGHIPNMAWLHDDRVQVTPMKPVSLDTLPLLDFQLLRNPSCYQAIDLLTSRGCPFGCVYCLEGGMRPYATHTPEWVDNQLIHLEDVLQNDRIFIYDPVFGLGRERTLEICRVLKDRRFTYAVESRVDVLSPDLLPILKEAGVEAVFLGIESASPGTLLRMNKVKSTGKAEEYVQSAYGVLRACFENDITPVLGLMLGFPGDTEEDYRATLRFVQGIAHLHERIAAQTGIETGFVPFAFYTKVYEGAPLAGSVEREFPAVILRTEPFLGERTVLSPAEGVDLELTQFYQNEVTSSGVYSSVALDRLWRYFVFSMERFLTDHPNLVDDDGVVILGDSLQRFPQEFNVAASVMYYDKSKDG